MLVWCNKCILVSVEVLYWVGILIVKFLCCRDMYRDLCFVGLMLVLFFVFEL